ncbi:hypothetical protein H8B09_17775 [Paenibacillus sp. PR3]|uniref:Bacterial spore germination immunoglobulin-like domain-containing protein n=1 Tax=Paenibacillus terricola TaxID=2763503 RepID=A0ABR8MXC4_9BACL|nr:Gmad2 immunoglobulin-like domain-containing protein [Paenibacillus terricola]MBD3920618.1 hypothetical protein [Paenibacillus terricola]
MARKYDSSWWLPRAGLALLLALIVGIAASCSNQARNDNGANSGTDSGQVSVTPGTGQDTEVDNGSDTGSNVEGTPVGGDKDPGTNSGSDTPTATPKPIPTTSEPNKPPAKPVDNSSGGSKEPVKEPVIVAENEAFRIYAPEENAIVGTTFKVSGEARVFEAAFSYSFEDGHNVLAEGHVTADQGAPEWGKFEFEVNFKNPTSPYGILIIYESSAKDGSPVHQLEIPVKFKDGIVKPVSGEG